jgi:hypothetical protein
MCFISNIFWESETVLIDFTPVRNGNLKLDAFAQQFSLEDLRAATNASIDLILDIIKDADDAQIVYIPDDPLADDPHAIPEERHLGWSLAHLIVHVTASAEENAAVSSILARGIPYPRDPRLRYETHWRTVTTKAQALQRLEETRRIRLAYLDTWPDVPHLDVLREVSDAYRERSGEQNAKAAFLGGLRHESNHYDQFREVARQARDAARPPAVAGAAD